MIGLHDASYARGGRTVLDRCSLSVAPGVVTGLVGASGTGKTTVLALLAGLERPDSGAVDTIAHGARAGLVLQGLGLVSTLTAAENVEVPLQAGVLGRLTPAEVRDRAAQLLSDLGLGSHADEPVGRLSGGQQQRVAIARALVIEPDVLLADEVSAALDAGWRDLVVGRIRAVAERGGTVVLATHDAEVAATCDTVLRLG